MLTIDTINITITQPQSPLGTALLKAFFDAPVVDRESADVRTTLSPPAIGELWPEQGGLYAGVSRGRDGQADGHLILHVAEAPEELNWADALKWAEGIEVDGHKDFHVPTRFESALLYANLQELFDPTPWYWTSTQYSVAGYAWTQYFYGGYQLSYVESYERRVRAVRRFAA